MIEQGDDLMSQVKKAAEQIIQGYGQGLLTVDILQAHMMHELRERQNKLLTQENVCEKAADALRCASGYGSSDL